VVGDAFIPRKEGLMGSFGFPEMALVLLIVILIFGTSRIPELGRGLGEGIRNFKKAVSGKDDSESEKTDKKP
jgi:sec-independent protein translocase protein TatA